jgi:hypothetical protein
MKALIFGLLLSFTVAAGAQDWRECEPPETGAPELLCFKDVTGFEVCSIVRYVAVGNIMLAVSKTLDGYEVLGWSGPCDQPSTDGCPSIKRQAFNDLRVNLINAQRAQLRIK